MSDTSARDQRFSDEELTAYLDGENELAPIVRISEALKTDRKLRERIKHLSVDKDAIAKAFQSVQPTNFPAASRLPQSAANSNRSFNYAQMAAGMIVALGIGFGASQWMMHGQDQRNWRDFVATYQALYVNETLASVQQSEPKLSSELTRVAATLGTTLDLSAMQSVPTLDYKRAQVLSFMNQPLIQLAFLSDAGQPIALCIIKTQDAENSAIRYENLEGLESATWAKNGFEYLLIGDTDKDFLSKTARQMSDLI